MPRKVDRFISAVEESLGLDSSKNVRQASLSALVHGNGIDRNTEDHRYYVNLLYRSIYEEQEIQELL